jgi:hypothetical protein
MKSTARASAVLLVLGLFAAVGWYARERASSCVVGVAGAEASITVAGLGSRAACDDFVRSNPREWYVRQSPPDGGVLCEVQQGQVRYAVRDRGTFMLVGRGVCSSLQNGANKLP